MRHPLTLLLTLLCLLLALPVLGVLAAWLVFFQTLLLIYSYF